VQVEARGNPIPANDAWIAALCRQYALPILSQDQHFELVKGIRIAVNHVLNLKKARWTAFEPVCSFQDAARGLERTPDLDPPDPRTVPVPVEVLAEETKISCTVGTLLWLDGR
jgi:hypothetical protein